MVRIELTEELVLNKNALPEELREYRYYRIEYYDNVNPYAIWAGRVLLPEGTSPEALEIILNNEGKRRGEN